MKYNLFYLDDETENMVAFKSLFRKEYNVFTTDSPKTGLEYLQDNDVDLIITDQRMPEMTGVEFLKKVFDIKPKKLPCRMIFSAYSKTQVIEDAKLKNWLSLFILKPCDPDELMIKVTNAIKNCNA
jgi:response regulator RpfG family c-di-GMP phosphodiesterase